MRTNPPPRLSYSEAARRHFDDAEALRRTTEATPEPGDPSVSRRANVDHLYGIATECALLGLLRTSPTANQYFDDDGAVKDPLRVHVNVLWDRFRREAPRLRLGAVVSRLNATFKSNPYAGWSVDQRYLSDHAVACEITEDTLWCHRTAATTCLTLLDQQRQPRATR